jgi:hypothetical protein
MKYMFLITSLTQLPIKTIILINRNVTCICLLTAWPDFEGRCPPPPELVLHLP